MDRPSDQGWAGCRGRERPLLNKVCRPCPLKRLVPQQAARWAGRGLRVPRGCQKTRGEAVEAALAKNVFRLGIFKLVFSHSARPETFRRSIATRLCQRQGFASDGGEAASTVGCQPPHTLCAARVNPSLRVPGPSGCAFLRSRSLNACMQHRSRGSIVPCLSPNPAVMPPAFVWLGGRRASHQVT